VAIETSVGGAEPAKARISFARVDALTLTTSFDDAIRRSLRPGTAHQRYTRMWRMGRWQEEDGLILGRIGFQSPSTTELFNEEVSDFVEEAFMQGATSPFAIDPSSQRIVFQVRSGVIRPHSFTGALQALLNEASEFERWRVRPETYEVDWETWVNSVDRIAQLRIRLERPAINAEPPPPLRPGSSRRARLRRPRHRATATTSRTTPATSSITCLTVPWGCGTSPRSNLPGPIVNTRPPAKVTLNTPIVNCVTRQTRLWTVAR
jgi:hypothetical protein